MGAFINIGNAGFVSARNGEYIDKSGLIGVFNRTCVPLPAIIFELKYDESSQAAIDQIKNRDYIRKVLDNTDNVLLDGISYDKKSKRHECKIEVYK